MINIAYRHREESIRHVAFAPKDFREATKEICEEALTDARTQLHPLLWNVEPARLEQRDQFVGAFKLALEQGIARQLASLQTDVQAIYQFDEHRIETPESWNGSLHFLVSVARPWSGMQALSRALDTNLVKSLKRLNWSRFRTRQFILEIQQATPDEIRRGLGYGAMFHAVYTKPVMVWPRNRLTYG